MIPEHVHNVASFLNTITKPAISKSEFNLIGFLCDFTKSNNNLFVLTKFNISSNDFYIQLNIYYGYYIN